MRIGDISRGRNARMQSRYRRYIRRIGVVVAILAALFVGYGILYFSPLFAVESVTVKGADHLTDEELTKLAAVPANTTLLRVDAGGIKDRVLAEPWVEDLTVNKIFPGTIELAITERDIQAVVEIPSKDAQSVDRWAIASDGMWLMKIPAEGTPEAASVSSKIYEDAESVLRISDVPYGLQPAVGTYCTDENVNNALAIITGMTTELADQVRIVSATGTETTTLTLDNGVQIAFGAAEDIRDKERVCLELMNEHEGNIAYINVRILNRPTWRSLG